MPSVRDSGNGVKVEIHVTPSAREDSIKCVDGVLRVKTTAPADKGNANRAVVKALKPLFGVCEIVAGHKSRRKTVHIQNLDSRGFKARLAALTG